ncbi:putative regulatory protein [Wickerhamomyces ciferrii]|uniref:Regulatory protein n=1 Tax=Wickerhamomyces ciferrii (strain ATCC 14091 / BCRC 22168 / CBS 111 / JCM 3599 / NBRC 0793 / NRRL Y-1031 F-60-10) TaxID=1206466 RepID=K0KHF9_WICCF|nr:putative regulatory protein [Wickerhamomyces ciferrii]CCH40608.1 putative regulatory protein [Wickerhamomyces ciferrii]
MDSNFQAHGFSEFQDDNEFFDTQHEFDQALMANVNSDMMYSDFQDSSPQGNEQSQSQFHSQLQQHNDNTQKRTRASGEVLALLVNEFNINANPNAQTRKRISEQTGMPERSVRIWFQNRRAKSRKLEKLQHTEKEDPYTFGVGSYVSSATRYDNIPLTLNNNYFFMDAKSLTVGSWKRIKSGNLSHDNIFSVKNLSNLSPFSINEIMNNTTDLMIIISRKNFEINYFFSAITDTSKILFRIFYPISLINNCSISITADGDDSNKSLCELKLILNKPPKFAVYFSQTMAQNINQWSICDDFSEGHQVNDAFVGGSGLPHVFTGSEQSLKFMNSFILDYNSTNIPQQEFSLPQRLGSQSPTTVVNNYPNPQPPQQLNENNKAQNQNQNNEISSFEFNNNPLLQHFVQDPNFVNDPNDGFNDFLKEESTAGTPLDLNDGNHFNNGSEPPENHPF